MPGAHISLVLVGKEKQNSTSAAHQLRKQVQAVQVTLSPPSSSMAVTLSSDSEKKMDPGFRNQMPEEYPPHLLL